MALCDSWEKFKFEFKETVNLINVSSSHDSQVSW
jgi:hypothetical protein